MEVIAPARTVYQPGRDSSEDKPLGIEVALKTEAFRGEVGVLQLHRERAALRCRKPKPSPKKPCWMPQRARAPTTCSCSSTPYCEGEAETLNLAEFRLRAAQELIAWSPDRREDSRMLVLYRDEQRWEDRRFVEFPSFCGRRLPRAEQFQSDPIAAIRHRAGTRSLRVGKTIRNAPNHGIWASVALRRFRTGRSLERRWCRPVR